MAKPSRDWILPRVLEQTYRLGLGPFAQDCGFNGPPFRWDEARRFLLRCELDAAFSISTALTATTWPTSWTPSPSSNARMKPRMAAIAPGTPFSEIYDAMMSGQPYPTRLDPPPADSRCCHPPR